MLAELSVILMSFNDPSAIYMFAFYSIQDVYEEMLLLPGTAPRSQVLGHHLHPVDQPLHGRLRHLHLHDPEGGLLRHHRGAAEPRGQPAPSSSLRQEEPNSDAAVVRSNFPYIDCFSWWSW